MDDWSYKPTCIDKLPANIDYIMFIDENGNSNMNDIPKHLFQNNNIELDKFFSITGCIIRKEQLNEISQQVLNLKNQYWPDGKYLYNKNFKCVCLHSREIRRHEGPFSEQIINYNNFIYDLSNLLKKTPIIILSSVINKYEHFIKYSNPFDPYNLCLDFILERFSKYILSTAYNGIIVLESRGKKEDRYLLEHIINILNNGTKYVTSKCFENIKGVYFNTKWASSSNGQSTYCGLEIADLCSYPIYKYVKQCTKDKAFLCIEDKFYNYPNYLGYGLKIFPQN